MMAIGARLLGAGRLREFRRHVYGHVFFAFFCAVVFTALSVLSSEIELEDEFTNMVDREDFEPLAKELWPIAILLQPFRAIVAVYGPILMACQGYVEWGVTVTALFLLLYLPLTAAGAVQNDVRLLMWANVAYYMVHSVLLIGLVHCRMLPRLLRPKPSSTNPEDAVSSKPAAAANQGSLAPTEA
jgi:Na+-driven multidrug efflux pump